MTDTIVGADAPAAETAPVTPAAAPAATPETPPVNAEAPQDKPVDKPVDTPVDKPADAPKDAEKPAGAPEKYEDFIAPEGAELDTEILSGFGEIAKELNLNQESAQKVIDKMAPIMATRQAAQMEQLRTTWHEQSTADKEFGGDKLQESTALAAKAMSQFATPELKEVLNATGLGNHPEIVRMMVRVGKALSEDTVITGAQKPVAGIRTIAEGLYPTPAAKSN